MFNEKLFSKGFFKVGDLKGLYHSLSSKWKKIWLVMKARYCSKQYLLMGWCIQMQSYYVQKEIYNLLISEISKLPTAKKKFEDLSICFRWSPDWLENHLLVPLNECAIHTKSREFQYKVLNRILPFNDFIF